MAQWTGRDANDDSVAFDSDLFEGGHVQSVRILHGPEGGLVEASETDPIPVSVIDAVVELGAGAAFVGRVGVDEILSMPASAATTDTVTAKLDVRNAHDGLTPLPYKHAFVNASSSGYTSLVAAVTGPDKRIRVLAYTIVVQGEVTVNFASASTAISANKKLAAGMTGAFNPGGHFQTAPAEALRINLGSAVAVGIDLTYVEVD